MDRKNDAPDQQRKYNIPPRRNFRGLVSYHLLNNGSAFVAGTERQWVGSDHLKADSRLLGGRAKIVVANAWTAKPYSGSGHAGGFLKKHASAVLPRFARPANLGTKAFFEGRFTGFGIWNAPGCNR
jgi:hypothetical protein